MDVNKIICAMFPYGNVEVCKAGEVFTLFMTGENMHSVEVALGIPKVLEKSGVMSEYQDIEVMKNEKSFYLLILKK